MPNPNPDQFSPAAVELAFKRGDRIPVRFRGTNLPDTWATVERVVDTVIYIRYDVDSPCFAGLIGILRLKPLDLAIRTHP